MRQAEDDAWVLAAVDGAAVSLLDAGCGTGDFLAMVLDARPGIRRAVGLDKSADNVREAWRAVAPFHDRIRLEQADLLEPPALESAAAGGDFDAIALMSVLHWLHPHEERVLSWLSGKLSSPGRLVLTSYHPDSDPAGFGGTDGVVRDAMLTLGLDAEAVTTRFARSGIVPIGARTINASSVRDILGRWFRNVEEDHHEAVVRIESSAEYLSYHGATFGSYYSRMIPVAERERFRHALGTVAVRRMDTLGHVTTMPVRRWICSESLLAR